MTPSIAVMTQTASPMLNVYLECAIVWRGGQAPPARRRSVSYHAHLMESVWTMHVTVKKAGMANCVDLVRFSFLF